MDDRISTLEEMVATQQKIIDKQKEMLDTCEKISNTKSELISILQARVDSYEKFIEKVKALAERRAS